ncbi:MAG TPA: class I SAM-dependent methyltransferase [Hydrogenophaga sp.]
MPVSMPSQASVAVSAQASSSASARTSKARFWNRIARQYAADPIADQAGYEHTLHRVQALLSSSDDVLELGCGTGSTALRLASEVRSLRATDVSDEMVAIAREKLQRQPTPQLSFEVADADTPSDEPGTFDAVLAFNLLHLVSDLHGTMQGVWQALRPGGLFISKTPCVGEMSPLIRLLAIPAMRAVGKAPPVLILRAQDIEEAIRQAGLEVLLVERHGTKGKDTRPFIVASKPKGAAHERG